MAKPKDALRSLVDLSAARAKERFGRCYVCRRPSVLAMLHKFEKDLLARGGREKYAGVTTGDLYTWSGAEAAGLSKESLRGHLRRHQPSVGKTLGW